MIYDDRDQYTISVRWIVESYSQETPDITTDQKIAIALPKIFNFDFPIYDESYRTTFEDKLIRHFYFHEINITSIGRWKFMLREKLNLIMPVYNKMYEAASKKFDPFIDTEMVENYTRKRNSNGNIQNVTNSNQVTNGESSNNINANSKGTQNGTIDSNKNQTTENDTNGKTEQINSDFPQATLAGKDYATTSTQNTNNSTATETIKSTGKETNSNTNDINSTTTEIGNTKNNITQDAKNDTTTAQDETESYDHTNTGFSSKSQQALLLEFYEALRNIDEMVFNELRDLFMLVF